MAGSARSRGTDWFPAAEGTAASLGRAGTMDFWAVVAAVCSAAGAASIPALAGRVATAWLVAREPEAGTTIRTAASTRDRGTTRAGARGRTREPALREAAGQFRDAGDGGEAVWRGGARL